MSRKTILILALVLIPVGLMVAGAAYGVGGPAFQNPHFVIAFALGATFSVLLAVGLFALSFYSARSGHDSRVIDERNGTGTDSDEP
jgi:thiol:disulfide interchange protein